MIQKNKKHKLTIKDVLSFLIPIVIAIILLIPVPYYITVGGGTIGIDEKIKVNNSYDSKGSFSCAYVSQTKGTIATYLLSKVIKNFELEKIDDVTLTNEDVKDYDFREELYFKNSLNNALFVAYNKASKKISVKDNKLYVLYVFEDADTSLETRDIILKVDDVDVSSVEEINDIIGKKNIGDKLNILVDRNGQKINTITKIIDIDGEKKIGVLVMNDISYETDPYVSFDFSGREAGSSGGLMIALSIYNKLIDEDITKGLKIVGTGTIDSSGVVGEIGGVKYKLQGAVKKHADVFLVPYENYDEALKEVKDNNYKIKLIRVSSFDEALEKLKNIN